MKKLGLLIVTLFATTHALASDSADYSNLTLAAIESDNSLRWTTSAVEPAEEKHQAAAFAEQADAMNEKINAKLEKMLAEKFNSQLD